MKKILLIAITLVLSLNMIYAQRPMENLDRGLVAVKVNEGVFLSWRITGQEWYDVQYNVYRNGTKLNSTPLNVSNFVDTGGALTSQYTVRTVLNGTEGTDSKAASVFANQYLEIGMRKIMRNGKDISHLFSLNDATVADLDGDGEMEVIIKRINSDFSVANDTAFSYFEAYKLDGTFMWAIDCGPNLVSSSHVETNLMAYDFDGDGKAEIIMRTADGTIDGTGTVIGSATANYRRYVNQSANMQYMTQGPEFLTLFDGVTGKMLDSVDYIARGSAGDWGDDYGHRANKFFFGAPFLDGRKPSILITRGIYTRIVMRTFDLVNKKLVRRWATDFDTNQWTSYAYQGNHNYTIADVDGDGRDEIVYGSMVVDDDGRGLYSTGYGHGDAIHVGDFNPYRKGLEVFACLENSPHWGAVLRDAATGEPLIKYVHGRDCGRCCAGNVTDEFPGAEVWSGGNMWSAATREVVGTSGGAENFILYWDGDLLQETFDYTSVGDVTSKGYGTPAVFKYDVGNIRTFSGTATNNHTKGNPCMQVDIFGDWREELILRTTDNMALRIYTTVDPTEYRNYTLLHDHQYRQAIAWQMCGYNQPPHVSYFLGAAEGITLPPPPVMTNNRTEVNTQIESSGNGKHLLLANTSGGNVAVNSTFSPSVLTINSPADYALTGNGSFTGNMRLIKQGMGTLTFSGTHSYIGATELWDGVTNFNGTLASPVWMNRFAELNGAPTLNGGLTMEYGAILRVANNDNKGTLQTSSFHMKEGAIVELDIYSSDLSADILKITGDLRIDAKSIFRLIPHNNAGENFPTAGRYPIAEVSGNLSGNLSSVIIEGLSGVNCSLIYESNKLYLEIYSMRAAGQVYWNGGLESGIWDLANIENFILNESNVSFVTGDKVIFNDNATSKTVTISSDVYPSEVLIDNSQDYTITGTGKISGSASLTKTGTGKLTINNANTYTGPTVISGGSVEVSTLATAQDPGALGALNSNPANLLLDDNASLIVTGNINHESAMTVGEDGGVFDISGTLTQFGAIAGGTLIKTGNGSLVIAGVNTHKKTILKAGTIKVLEEPNLYNGYLGDTLVLESGTIDCLNNEYSYSKANWNIVVPAGKKGTINLDGRCTYSGSLTGSGELTVYTPYVRSDLAGNWSKFEGTLKATGDEIRFNNNYGMPLATLNLASSTNAYNEKGGSFTVGSVTGSGTLGGNLNWIIGTNNKSTTFSGQISGTSSLTKVGTGTLTLSGESTCTGEMNITEGTLTVNNTGKTGSATGAGKLIVSEGGTLTGKGVIANSRVELKDGSLFKPGYLNAGTLSMNSILVQDAGAVIEYRLNGNGSLVNLNNLKNLAVNGTIRITLKSGYIPVAGDEFSLWSASAINSSSKPTLELPELSEGLMWDTSSLITRTGLLKVIPVPSGLDVISLDEILKVTVLTTSGLAVEASECRADAIDEYINNLQLESGIYLLKMDGKRGSSTRKFVK